MRWQLQLMGVCALVMCVCTCVRSGRVNMECSGERVCRELNSQEALLNCLWVCASEQLGQNSAPSAEHQRMAPPHGRGREAGEDDDGDGAEEEEEEQSVALGLLLSILAPADANANANANADPAEAHSARRRAYSMEHFRWGKPAGRKRRPIRVHTLERRAEPTEHRPPTERPYRMDHFRWSQPPTPPPTQPAYRMSHFRWSQSPTPPPTPPPTADKRYGGFMKPSHKPLLTLLRHVIAADGQ